MPALITSLARWSARIVAAGLLCTFASVDAKAPQTAPTLRWKIVAEYPHDASGFTQGLLWHQGRLFESDGQYGASQVAEKELATGKTLRATPLPASEFGEGLALHAGALWQLTWREGVLHRYDLTLQQTGSLRYGGEGWGITSDGAALIVSNGSATLTWVDPAGPSVLRKVDVRDGDMPVPRLNELEWIEGSVYANVWMTDRIARIAPASGAVTGWLDLAALKQKAGITAADEARGAVLNGIAWRADKRHLLVTGKYWPTIYEIKLLSK
ncbi:MAG: glutaminyl-peptide cyclotransferase [Stagnimonas sp.]|nr:glutaminyl-peptide cyclotransferase [Stagnimonas sp.]